MRPINLCGYLTQIKTNGCSLRSSIHLHLIAGAQGLMITNISLHTAAQSPNTFPFNDFSSFYRPQRSCGQGYVFTRVCDSVNRGGSPENPPGTKETPPRDQGEPPLDQGEPPTPPGPRRTPPPGPRRTPPGPRRTPPPGRTLQHTVNERPVRILLECILVL